MTSFAVRAAPLSDSAEVSRVILSANPHLEERIQRFLASGGRWAHATAVVGEVDNHIRSCAVVFRRELWISADERARIGGIGAVSTHPSARGQGYATRVLRFCEELLAREGHRLAGLFCNIVEFYRRLGWLPIEEDFLEFVCESPWPNFQNPNYRICAVDSGIPQKALEELCERAAPESASALVRSPEIWNDYQHWHRDDDDLRWAALIGDMPVAFVRGRRTPTGVLLQEAIALSQHQPALLTLIGRQAQIAGERKQFQTNLSRQHPLAKLLEQKGAKHCWKKTSGQTTMLMLKTLKPGLSHSHGLSTERFLTIQDFERKFPWEPRTWWAIDRF